ncbi:MAG: MarR family transcriptional regulator [Chloroflexota bacterium]
MATPSRPALIRELLDELAAHTPSGVMRHLRRWPSGPLSLVHLHVLAVLDEEGPIPMRALAESLDVSQASATGIVDRMEQRGLVERRRGDADRRVIRVASTAAGRDLLAEIAAQRRGHFAAVLEELTDDELGALLLGSRALHRARERLHASPTPAESPAESPAEAPR